MTPPPPLVEDVEDEDWLITYADAITLLLAFFVMLVSFSKIDMALFDQVTSGIKQEIGVGKDKTASTMQSVKAAMETAAFEVNMEQVVDVQKDERGVAIEMASASFFKPGTAEIMPQALPLIVRWAKTLSREKFKFFYIEVEGHTDDVPIHTAKFPSNWELSAVRAAAVARAMIANGVHAFQIKVTGFGSSHPKVPNRNRFGEPIKANQAKNRRVIIRLVPMSKKEKEGFLQVLSDERIVEIERQRREKDAAKRKAIQEKLDAAKTDAAKTAPPNTGSPNTGSPNTGTPGRKNATPTPPSASP